MYVLAGRNHAGFLQLIKINVSYGELQTCNTDSELKRWYLQTLGILL